MTEYHTHACKGCGKARIPKTGKRGRPSNWCPACRPTNGVTAPVADEPQAYVEPIEDDEPEEIDPDVKVIEKFEKAPAPKRPLTRMDRELPDGLIWVLLRDVAKGDILYSNYGRKKLGAVTANISIEPQRNTVKFRGPASPLTMDKLGKVVIKRKS